ncbi:deoxyhypusine hydroxylase-like isoform X12 [Planococcus citri]|uniref:deoxyhypusine hydroxylase-like isoform X12 n=1 Tax=Planococcus citri TaxID=170843 RepID=UPI0031FA038B
MSTDVEYIRKVGAELKNPQYPLKRRFRALFTLKNLKNDESVEMISQCFNDKSALLKHELAYCLGQINLSSAVSTLIRVLEDETQQPVVRHEAAEALGAIGDKRSIDVLRKYEKSDIPEIAETCEIALGRLEFLDQGGVIDPNVYGTVDPAPPSDSKDLPNLMEMYLNANLSIFERYRAMFALRNLNTDFSAEGITKGFNSKSALFRHEVAFVLGQLQNPVTIPALLKVVEDEGESNMVRHEAIEALGSIGTPDCVEIIRRFANDSDDLVRESCLVALDIQEYNHSSEFQPLDGGDS